MASNGNSKHKQEEVEQGSEAATKKGFLADNDDSESSSCKSEGMEMEAEAEEVSSEETMNQPTPPRST
jgi:hypothetical protein